MSSLAINYPFLKKLPLIVPDIADGDSLQQNFLEWRVSLVAAATIVSYIALIINSLPGLGMLAFVTGFAILFKDRQLNERAADKKAAEIFMRYTKLSDIPADIQQRLCSSPQAAQYFVDMKPNAKMLNYTLNPIWCTDLKAFKIFIDAGADIKAPCHGIHFETYFSMYVKSKENKISFLDYVFKTGKVQASDFSPQLHAEFYRSVRSAVAFKFLKEKGFDVKAKDINGLTSLQNVAGKLSEAEKRTLRWHDRIPLTLHMLHLVKCGASLSELDGMELSDEAKSFVKDFR